MSFRSLLLLTFALFLSTGSAFAPHSVMGGVSGGSSFVVSQKASHNVAQRNNNYGPSPRTGRSELFMGSQAKFGVFSPAVYAAKIALGQEKLNKLRGKGISLHSQAIGDFCEWAGAYHLRTRLIKKAKTNGDILGFLV